MKKVIVFIALITLVSCVNSGSDELKKEKAAIKLHKEIVRGKYKVVDTLELKKWIDEKKDMVIIDTMPYKASYKKNHVPGAKQMLFPIPEKKSITEKEKKKLKDIIGKDLNRTVVVYCGFVKCTRSHNGAMWAAKLGYKNVYRHPGGIFAWKEAQYPIGKVK
jgi:thiosulfate/3-mercaptopyruvate sulfurtransferase